MNKRGCDISAAGQGQVDFDLLKLSGLDFVFAKATEGTGFVDPQFSRNWPETKRVGMQRGAYHFARPDLGNSADAEATDFIAHLGPLDSSDLLALDYEVSWDGDVVNWCKRFLDDVYAMTAIRPYIYLNQSHLHLDWSSVIPAYPLWLAVYDNLPDVVPQTPWPVAIKQWTDTGTLPGITGQVDLNTRFIGGNMNPEVQAAIDASIAAYGQRLQAELDDPVNGYAKKADLAHAHDVPAHSITFLAQTTSEPK